MRLKGGGIHLGYHTHYVVDGGKHRIILSVLVILGEVMDNQPMLDLLWRMLFRWHEARREQQMFYLSHSLTGALGAVQPFGTP